MRRALVLVVAVLWMMSFTTGHEVMAGENDFRLHRLTSCLDGTTAGPPGMDADGNRTGGCIASRDDEAFKELSKTLGGVFAPSTLQPADTMGEAGFAVGVQSKTSLVPEGDYWRALNSNREAADPAVPTLTMLQVHLRKGFPFSIEIDTLFVWLLDSEMFWIGGGIKWAILDKVHTFAPDLAVHGHGGTVVGAPDMSLTTAGVDISLSKAFGVGGIIELTPYAGANLVWVITSSRVIDADPTYSATPSAGYSPETVFGNLTTFLPRGFVGMRFSVFAFSATAEFATDGNVHNIGINLGAEF